MLVDTKQIMPITKLQKTLTQTVRKVAENKETFYILKNNNMEAVLIPFERFEYLSALAEMCENSEISETIKKRLESYDPSKTISWDSVRDEPQAK